LHSTQATRKSQRQQKSLAVRPAPTQRQKDIAAKMKDRKSKDKHGQLVTGDIFYCRASADFSSSATNKLSCMLTVQRFEAGNKNIPLIRYPVWVNRSALCPAGVF